MNATAPLSTNLISYKFLDLFAIAEVLKLCGGEIEREREMDQSTDLFYWRGGRRRYERRENGKKERILREEPVKENSCFTWVNKSLTLFRLVQETSIKFHGKTTPGIRGAPLCSYRREREREYSKLFLPF